MRIGSLFSGIGGIELGLERAGAGKTVWHVESDPFCRSVLSRHWPDAVMYDDVRLVGAHNLAECDLIAGGFPCQDISNAGRRAGIKGVRSEMWYEYLRIIREMRPLCGVIENVSALRTRGLREVLSGLAGIGYDAEWVTFDAGWIGAPHLRSRIWVVFTDAQRHGVRGKPGWLTRAVESAFSPIAEHIAALGLRADAGGMRRLEQSWKLASVRGWPQHCGWSIDEIERVDDGIPRGLVGPRRKALGNSAVVACAAIVGRAIVENVSTERAGGR